MTPLLLLRTLKEWGVACLSVGALAAFVLQVPTLCGSGSPPSFRMPAPLELAVIYSGLLNLVAFAVARVFGSTRVARLLSWYNLGIAVIWLLFAGLTLFWLWQAA